MSENDDILLWAVNLRLLAVSDDYEKILSVLPDEDVRRAKRYVKTEDQIRSAVGALLSRRMLEYCIPKEKLRFPIRVKRTEYGKPYAEGYSNVHFSLSHSGNIVVCAAAPEPVGVDVEEVRKIVLNDFYNWLTDEEKSTIDTAKDPVREFYRI